MIRSAVDDGGFDPNLAAPGIEDDVSDLEVIADLVANVLGGGGAHLTKAISARSSDADGFIVNELAQDLQYPARRGMGRNAKGHRILAAGDEVSGSFRSRKHEREWSGPVRVAKAPGVVREASRPGR